MFSYINLNGGGGGGTPGIELNKECCTLSRVRPAV